MEVLDKIADILDPEVSVDPGTIAMAAIALFIVVLSAVYVGKKL